MEVKLSILIATMPSRNEVFSMLWAKLSHQIIVLNDPNVTVEGLYDNSMAYNIGVKRNKLLARATGEYIVFIDDDDTVSPFYIQQILDAIKSKPDCVGISGTMTTNGSDLRQWRISKEYGGWYEERGIYYRTPNHISPVRRELALQAGFPEIPFAEDAEYSYRLLPLLKTEVIIPTNLYHYDYRSDK